MYFTQARLGAGAPPTTPLPFGKDPPFPLVTLSLGFHREMVPYTCSQKEREERRGLQVETFCWLILF